MDLSTKKRRRFKQAKIKVEPRIEVTYVKREIEKCSICWSEPPVNAIRLDCNHVFCFLCIKSAATTTKRCALCRSEIPMDFNYGEYDIVGKAKLPSGSDDGHFWFYEGKTGWWLYDTDTNRELEMTYQNEGKYFEKLIAGQVYVINLRRLKQYQKDNQTKSRRICRDTLYLDNILGIAGLRDKKLLKTINESQNVAEKPTDLRF